VAFRTGIHPVHRGHNLPGRSRPYLLHPPGPRPRRESRALVRSRTAAHPDDGYATRRYGTRVDANSNMCSAWVILRRWDRTDATRSTTTSVPGTPHHRGSNPPETRHPDRRRARHRQRPRRDPEKAHERPRVGPLPGNVSPTLPRMTGSSAATHPNRCSFEATPPNQR